MPESLENKSSRRERAIDLNGSVSEQQQAEGPSQGGEPCPSASDLPEPTQAFGGDLSPKADVLIVRVGWMSDIKEPPQRGYGPPHF